MNNLSHMLFDLKNILPWISFFAGFGGSLHCVGMCGGLVTATCQKTHDIFRYQMGRLLGYLLLGLFAGVIGNFFSIEEKNPRLALIPGLILGGLFLFWGIQNFINLKIELPFPKIFHKIYGKMWTKLILKNHGFSRSFFTGFLSIFLPCGLLYGTVLGIAAFEHSFYALFSMFFFWLGTLPSMVFAPSIVQKILRPLKMKLPKTYAIGLIIIGMATISYRVIRFQEVNGGNKTKAAVHQCH